MTVGFWPTKSPLHRVLSIERQPKGYELDSFSAHVQPSGSSSFDFGEDTLAVSFSLMVTVGSCLARKY